MTVRSRFSIHPLVTALAFAALALGCGDSHTMQIDSSTNWLHACESSADCGDLSCVCGVCNVTCTGDNACGGLDSNAECSSASSEGASCGGTDANVCILRCSSDLDCKGGLNCENGLCADTAPTASVSDDAGRGHDAGSAVGVEVDSGVPDYGFDFVQIAIGGRHGCGLVSDGSLLCWGLDSDGQLADASVGADFMQIAAGGYHTCGIRTDGSLLCWGGGALEVGQVTGPNEDGGSDFTQVAAGEQHTCALRSDASLICWGNDNYGR
jgi:hypothetical protein